MFQMTADQHLLRQIEDEQWMQEAIHEALKARDLGEVPVGAIVVLNGEIIGRGHNSSIQKNDPSAHAEIMALRNAGLYKANYRLPGAVIYITLEPCVMCVGAMLHARLDRVIYGAHDLKTGAATSILNLFDEKKINHQTTVSGGVLSDTCSLILKEFFKAKRDSK
jgi:tRNA(adenine34) deaminase